MRRILFVPLLLALLAPVATFGADSPLQGKWIPVRAEMAGLRDRPPSRRLARFGRLLGLAASGQQGPPFYLTF